MIGKVKMKENISKVNPKYVVVLMGYSLLIIWEMFLGRYRIHSSEMHYNIIPLRSIIEFINGFTFKAFLINIVANIVVFVPFGILIPLVIKELRGRLKQLILSAMGVIFVLEILQMLLRVGVFDVDDIILNIVGVAVGYVIVMNLKNIHIFVNTMFHFIIQEALSCIFPVSVFAILALSKVVKIPFMSRYDLILLLCIIVQILLVVFKYETMDEVKVIFVFHIIGLMLEIYKVHMGSWIYPEKALMKIGEVPIYSGFMYSSVASYVCQAWKRLKLDFIGWPNRIITYVLALIIYLNFFTHHYLYDIRWIIIAALFIIFWKSFVVFQVREIKIKMPIIVSFFLIGLFIWIAENISTYLGAWKYPNQLKEWHLVHAGKITSWFLLVIISVIIVHNLKVMKYKEALSK